MSVFTSGALLPVAIAAPIAGAVLAPLLARLSARLSLVGCLLGQVVGTAVLIGLAGPVFRGEVRTEHLGLWRPIGGAQLGVTFVADPLGLVFGLLCGLIGIVLLTFSAVELGGLGRHELGGYSCLFQLLISALVASALTADVLDLFVWFEVAALASYGLTAFFLERPPALEAAFKIMVLTNVASFAVFVGVALLYSGEGAVNMGQLARSIGAHAKTADLVALALMIAGFGTKAGLVPFHAWLPDAHSAAPGPVSALFSGLMVYLGVVASCRLVFDVYPGAGRGALPLLITLGGASAVLGAALALVQDDLKRILAFDTVSQVGVLALAVGVGSGESLTGMVYHLINHALFKTLLFLCAGAILHATGMTKLSEMGGLARRRPVTTVAFVIGVIAIAGVPPLNGYVSLGLIHHAVEESHPWVLIVLTAAQVLTVAALARATYLALFRRRSDDYDQIEDPTPGMIISFGSLALACVAFGVFPGWVLNHIARQAAGSLTDGRAWAAAAIGDGGRLSVPVVTFQYLQAGSLLTAAGTVIAGCALAAWSVRSPQTVEGFWPLRWLRRAHSGSVNDYATYSAIGLVGCIAVLLAIRA